jgi:hypothetical protein
MSAEDSQIPPARSVFLPAWKPLRKNFRDGNLGLMWPAKYGVAANRRLDVRKRRILDTRRPCWQLVDAPAFIDQDLQNWVQ